MVRRNRKLYSNSNLQRVINWLREANSQIEMLRRRNLECWNCGSRSHKRFQCSKSTSHSCSYCGNKGIRTCECSCEFASQAIDGFSRTPRYNIQIQIPNDLHIHESHQSDDDVDFIELHPEGDMSDLEKL